MFKDNEVIFKTKAKAPLKPAKGKQLYSYNILPFDFPEGKQRVWFTTDERPGFHRFALEALPEEDRGKFITDGVPAQYVYTRFEKTDGAIPVNIDLRKHPGVARAYFTRKLNVAMQKYADVLLPNFLHDTSCWFEFKDTGNGKYRTFKKFSLRVQFAPDSKQPELLISYDGCSRTTAASLKELTEMKGFRRNMLRRAVFRGRCYSENRLPEAARYHPEEVFPLLNRQIISLLHIRIPFQPNKEKHRKFRDEVKWFYTQYAKTKEFMTAIPHQGQFRRVDQSERFSISTNQDLLEFGEGHTGREIIKGFRNHGPVKLPPCSDVTSFYIYAAHQKKIRDKLDLFLAGNAGEGNRITQFTRIPTAHDEKLDIVFDAGCEPLESILKKIRLLETEPGRCYYAFFINPWAQFEPVIKKRNIYYRVKEALLLRGIMMQNMDAKKLTNGNLHYFTPNLATAFTGKLGGIPWRLKRDHKKELIVGFGVFQSQKYNLKYTGSSVCFSNDGTFETFDCFRADDTYVLAATVEKALYSYVKTNEKPQRLVIHFYRKLSYKALKPVEKMLRSLKFDIPVIIVSINKTYSNNITAFIHGDDYGLPAAGTVINYRPGHYLLYLNDRMPGQTPYNKAMPMPLKISLWANKKEVISERETVSTLMQQVYDFCFLYYRSVKHARLPVTIVYPEMLAALVPYFSNEVLQEERAGIMMFL